MSTSSGPPLSRRRLLQGAAAAALLAACTDDAADPDPTPTTSPAADPDISVLESAAAAERTLLADYAQRPRLSAAGAAALARLVANHEAHLVDLEAAIVTLGGHPTPSASGSASGGPSGSTSASSTAAPSTTASVAPPRVVPRTPAQLKAAEQRTGRAALELVRRAGDGDVALLLAEIGASHAQHVVAVGRLR